MPTPDNLNSRLMKKERALLANYAQNEKYIIEKKTL